MNSISKSAWWWVPTLYFAEGIPYFIVNNISIMLFTDMGVPKDVMSLYTSLLYLPWVIKPLWSPFIDIIRTKRWWILSTEVVICACFIALTLSVPTPDGSMMANMQTPIGMFAVSVIVFYLIALTSATHDIAADCSTERISSSPANWSSSSNQSMPIYPNFGFIDLTLSGSSRPRKNIVCPVGM